MEEKAHGKPETETLESPDPHAAFDVEGEPSGDHPLPAVPSAEAVAPRLPALRRLRGADGAQGGLGELGLKPSAQSAAWTARPFLVDVVWYQML